MELKDYTTEQLKDELKRRRKEELREKESVMRCRHCEFCQQSDKYSYLFKCLARTYTRKARYKGMEDIIYNYVVKRSDKACDRFKRKEDNGRH